MKVKNVLMVYLLDTVHGDFNFSVYSMKFSLMIRGISSSEDRSERISNCQLAEKNG